MAPTTSSSSCCGSLARKTGRAQKNICSNWGGRIPIEDRFEQPKPRAFFGRVHPSASGYSRTHTPCQATEIGRSGGGSHHVILVGRHRSGLQASPPSYGLSQRESPRQDVQCSQNTVKAMVVMAGETTGKLPLWGVQILSNTRILRLQHQRNGEAQPPTLLLEEGEDALGPCLAQNKRRCTRPQTSGPGQTSSGFLSKPKRELPKQSTKQRRTSGQITFPRLDGLASGLVICADPDGLRGFKGHTVIWLTGTHPTEVHALLDTSGMVVVRPPKGVPRKEPS